MNSFSIKTKLVVLFSLFIAAISLFIYLYFPRNMEAQSLRTIAGKSGNWASMIALAIEPSMTSGVPGGGDKLMESARQKEELVYVVVVDESDRLFAAFNKVKADAYSYLQTTAQGQPSANAEVYQSVAPVMSNGRTIGRAYVGLSLAQLRADAQNSTAMIGAVSLMIFIIGVIGVYGISSIAISSLTHMVQTTQSIARGDIKRRAEVSTNDEVGDLAKSFNQMVDRLESARRELESLNKRLEGRVKERTRELLQEIAERKQAEEKISEQAALLDVSQDAILVRDLDDKIMFWNQGAEHLYGWASADVLGRSTADLLQSRTSTDIHGLDDTLYQKGEWRGEMQQVTKSGKEIMVESRWTLVRDMSRNPKSVLIVNTDITEKKALEKQFLRVQRMEGIGTLAGGIAHDLNNVLAPILMSIEVFRTRLQDEPSQRLLGSLESSAKRGADMVKQVLTFARGVDGERMTLRPKHLINEMQTIVQETFPKNIDVITHIPKDTWSISGDATQLHQVLLNLCVNARDAMPSGGTLTLSVENMQVDQLMANAHDGSKPGPFIAVTVSDTGCGMTAEIIDKIFEPFFTTKESGLGTGLGLSTVHSIVKSHNGFLAVRSAIDRGSDFKIYLPASNATETHQAAETRAALPMGRGELILIVDDEAAICQITKTMLESFGYQTVTANDGIEGVGVHGKMQGQIKLILTDMMMPVMGGPEMIRNIRSIDHEVRIVASSGLSSGYAGLDEESIDAILPKPYTADKLLTILHELFEQGHEGTPDVPASDEKAVP